MKILIATVILILSSVLGYSQNKSASVFKINTFTKVPNEIDGCGGYFFLSKSDQKTKKYLSVNDFARFLFMKIDRRMVRFTLIKNYSIGKTTVYLYENELGKLKMEVKTKYHTGPESNAMTGTLTLQFLNGQQIVQDFIGDLVC